METPLNKEKITFLNFTQLVRLGQLFHDEVTFFSFPTVQNKMPGQGIESRNFDLEGDFLLYRLIFSGHHLSENRCM